MRVHLSRGFLYLTASAFTFSIMSMLVKTVGQRVSVGEIFLIRLLVMVPIPLVALRRAGISPWGNDKLGLVSRGVVIFFGTAAYYLSLQQLSLADATTIQTLTPVVTALLAWWLLKEKVGWSTGVAI